MKLFSGDREITRLYRLCGQAGRGGLLLVCTLTLLVFIGVARGAEIDGVEIGGIAADDSSDVITHPALGGVIVPEGSTPDAVGNTVTVGATYEGLYSVAAGGSFGPGGLVTNNILNITGVSISDKPLLFTGGVAAGDEDKLANVSNNRVNVTNNASLGGATLDLQVDVNGGTVSYGNVTNNWVTVTDSDFLGFSSLYGGFSEKKGDATYNRVEFTGDSADANIVGGGIAGGWAQGSDGGGNANYNQVTVTDVEISHGVIGGRADHGDARQNTVNIGAGTKIGSTKVWFKSGTEDIYTEHSYGATGALAWGEASANTINVKGAGVEIGYSLVGGISLASDSIRNTVNLEGGSITGTGEVMGGLSLAGSEKFSGYEGDARENRVNITGDLLDVGAVYGGKATKGDALANQVAIYGNTTISGSLYGGWSDSGSATNNLVSIVGTPSITGSIFGGGGESHSDDHRTGNTLFTDARGATKSIKAESIGNFENYNFIIDSQLATPVYKINSINLQDTNLRVVVAGGKTLAAGDSFTLFGPAGGTIDTGDNGAIKSFNGESDPQRYALQQGVALRYGVDFAYDAENFSRITLQTATAAPFTRVVSQTQQLSLLVGRQVADFISDAGIGAALNVFAPGNAVAQGWVSSPNAMAAATPTRYYSCPTYTRGGGVGGSGVGIFAAFNGGTSKYDLDYASEVEIDHLSLLTGVTGNIDTGVGQLLLGAFFEGGIGHYDNEVGGYTYANNENFNHIGGGILARFDSVIGLYGETVLNLGRGRADFNATDPYSLSHISYVQRSTYYGASGGLGYLANLGIVKLDSSLRYYWSGNHNRDLVLLGDPFDLNTSNSHRLRLGSRAYFQLGRVAPYVGAAYQYEFAGKSRGSVWGTNLQPVRLQGSTGSGELGLHIGIGPFYAEAGVKGYIGKRRGVSGNLDMGISF